MIIKPSRGKSSNGKSSSVLSRRRLLATGAGLLGTVAMPYLSRAADRPMVSHGVQSGDVSTDSGMIWARADRPAQMMVEVSTTESFKNARALPPVAALPDSDFTAKMLVDQLPAGQDIFYRVAFRDLAHTNIISEPVTGRFRTAPADRRDVSFVWGGDVAGQGFGINADDGGMFTYATMRKHNPDFLIHNGDTIYADGVIAAETKTSDGTIWKNSVIVPEKSKVAETLDEFRAAHKYNFLDDHLRAFNAEVPIFVQWDDHEVTNNWSLSKQLPAAYKERNISLLAERGARAFHEMYPIRTSAQEPGRIYRTIHYGPLVDVFMLDERSYRGPNGDNLQTSYGRGLFHRSGPARLAEARTVGIEGALEGDRIRHAAQHRGRRRRDESQGLGSGRAGRWPGAGARTRNRGSVAVHQDGGCAQHGVADGRRALHRGELL